MITMLQRLVREDAAAHLLEYSLVVLGLGSVVLEPYLFIAAFYRLAELVNVLVSRLTAFF